MNESLTINGIVCPVGYDPGSPLARELTQGDMAALDTYEEKCADVKRMTNAVILGSETGLLLFGEGGTGKSYSIRDALAAKDCQEVKEDLTGEQDEPAGFHSYIVHQGRITPKGLVTRMASYPDSIHVIEDAETLWDAKDAMGVMRMALHSQDHSLHSVRRITWSVSGKGSYAFDFRGGLIVVGNRKLEDSSEARAVATRCSVLNMNVTDGEIIAKMKHICEQGYRLGAAALSKNECYGVLEFMLRTIYTDPEIRQKNRALNFRILIRAFRFACMDKLGERLDWKATMVSALAQEAGANGKRTRKERVHDERAIALAVEQEHHDKRFASEEDKLAEFARRVGRDAWTKLSADSPEWLKGLRAARADFARKKK